MPLLMPGQKKRTPFWVSGAGPGMRVVTALMMVDLLGPRETLPPQVSWRLLSEADSPRVGRRRLAAGLKQPYTDSLPLVGI